MTAGRETANEPRAVRRAARRGALFHAGVLLLAATAHATATEASWFGLRGPPCPVGVLLGEHCCPGCGLTRGTALAVQGQRQRPRCARSPLRPRGRSSCGCPATARPRSSRSA